MELLQFKSVEKAHTFLIKMFYVCEYVPQIFGPTTDSLGL